VPLQSDGSDAFRFHERGESETHRRLIHVDAGDKHLRTRQHPQEPSWSERRRYCRDEYDDSTWSPFIEVVIARVCLVAAVILIGLAVWFA
jgi:hypothetical protein